MTQPRHRHHRCGSMKAMHGGQMMLRALMRAGSMAWGPCAFGGACSVCTVYECQRKTVCGDWPNCAKTQQSMSSINFTSTCFYPHYWRNPHQTPRAERG
jgi:hypothetical protein